MNIHAIAKQIRSFADELEAVRTEQPDPYAEEKKAHAEGKVIQFKPKAGNFPWIDDPFPEWADHMDYRIKPDEIPWIEWHGGPCPLKDEEVEEWEYKFDSGVHIKEPCEKPSAYNWGMDGDGILAYRVLKTRTPKPKVPLGPEDVLPGSIFIVPTRKPSTWHAVTGVYEDCVQLDHGDFPFDELMEDGWQINRSIPQTGKWNPDAWESCEK
jgi:hypothetical protein